MKLDIKHTNKIQTVSTNGNCKLFFGLQRNIQTFKSRKLCKKSAVLIMYFD